MTDKLTLEQIIKIGKKIDFWRCGDSRMEGYYRGVKIEVWPDDNWNSHIKAEMAGIELGGYSFGGDGYPTLLEPNHEVGNPEIEKFLEYVQNKYEKNNTYENYLERRAKLLKIAQELAK